MTFWTAFCGERLPVTPWGDFLDAEKVTKDAFRRRGFRFPRLLKTSTLEPAKRNRARFPFDSFRGGRWTVLPAWEKTCGERPAHLSSQSALRLTVPLTKGSQGAGDAAHGRLVVTRSAGERA